MFRRIVSLFVLPSMLLSQSAAFGHSHGENESAVHDLRWHVHTFRSSRCHEPGQHHHGSADHHHHHDHDHDGAGDQPDSLPDPLPENDHDSDAVFIDRVEVVLNGRTAVDQAIASWIQLDSVELCLFKSNGADSFFQAAYWTHAPPSRASACPLYVWHLTLLI